MRPVKKIDILPQQLRVWDLNTWHHMAQLDGGGLVALFWLEGTWGSAKEPLEGYNTTSN